jgi:NAD-dependent deacetylase
MDNTDLRVRDFESVVFFTGAGLSAASGIPTYRGKGGVWKEYDYQRYACQAAFDRDPEGVWEFHNYRRELVGECAPTRAHVHIAECQKTMSDVTVVTQNIDGMHQLAGAERVLELHGSLWRTRCDHCGMLIQDREVPVADLHCAECAGRYRRPDIIWFGDSLDEGVIGRAVAAIERCTLLVSIGTSGTVYPAAQMPMYAKQRGATLIEVNPEETPMSRFFDATLRCGADQAMDLLCCDVESCGA